MVHRAGCSCRSSPFSNVQGCSHHSSPPQELLIVRKLDDERHLEGILQ